MTTVGNKTAYPYVTEFKKEPYHSFVLKKNNEIKSFYLSAYENVKKICLKFEKLMLTESTVNLKHVYWFLLLKKYLKEIAELKKDDFISYIKQCEIISISEDSLGFKLSPHSSKKADIWSTYFALSSLHLLDCLELYASSIGWEDFSRKITNFINAHKKNEKFLHCLEKECQIRKHPLSSKTLFYVLEILTMLGVDVRSSRELFHNYLNDRKKSPSVVFKLLCMKYLDIDSEVKDKELQYLLENQVRDGGFNFQDEDGKISSSFWIVNVIENYSWLIDYNPFGIYSFITKQFSKLLNNEDLISSKYLDQFSKLTLTLSLIWNKLIDHIERFIFKQLDDQSYINVEQIETSFGLSHGIDEIISYINMTYNFNLNVIDNELEFAKYVNMLSEAQSSFLSEFYALIHHNSIVSLTDLNKRYKMKYGKEELKFKEEILKILNELTEKRLFKGSIRTKRGFSFKTKYYFYLDFLLDKIIVSDKQLNSEIINEEKKKIEEIKNDIYNLIIKLNDAPKKIQEEISSYLIIDEINYAKERLKYLLRNLLMEADFLNENIENSFNMDLKYINIYEVLKTHISTWNRLYGNLKKRLNDLESVLSQQINEKEEVQNLNLLLDELDDKIFDLNGSVSKKLNQFRNLFAESFKDDCDSTKVWQMTQHLNKFKENVNNYDRAVLNISQRILSDQKEIQKKHKEVIEKWVKIKENADLEFDYYFSGFQLFDEIQSNEKKVAEEIENDFSKIKEEADTQIQQGKFQIAFDLIKKESENLLKQKRGEITVLQEKLKDQIASKQKIAILLKHAQANLKNLEENIIKFISTEMQGLENKVIEERNRNKIEKFNDFVSESINSLKEQLKKNKISTEEVKIKKIVDVVRDLDSIIINFNDIEKKYIKKLQDLKEVNIGFDVNSLSTVQWEQFRELLFSEVNNLKEEQVSEIISNQILLLTEKGRTDRINLKELAKNVDLKCKALVPKVKEIIETSKIQGELQEDAKELVVHTDSFYKNQELGNYVEGKLFKFIQEKVGKFLALFESCVKNNTLGVNIVEVENRVTDLGRFDGEIKQLFLSKVNELKLDNSRKEFIELKSRFYTIINANKLAIESIGNNVLFFNNLQKFIVHKFNDLTLELEKTFSRVLKEIDAQTSYIELKDLCEAKKMKFDEILEEIFNEIDKKLDTEFNKATDFKKLEPELREFYVKQKQFFNTKYDSYLTEIGENINTIEFETYRAQLLEKLSQHKIHLSQLLGRLQARVEDYIETEQFKKAYVKIRKREREIEESIKVINKDVKNALREYNKFKDFETRNKHIIEDFETFLKEFREILTEKVKTAEEQILKAYVQMAIKAIANELLTLCFLQDELKIKKQKIQQYLISLISGGSLKGKYDPQLGIYYENPEKIKSMDQKELEVMNKTNYKIHRIMRRLKIFANQYGSTLGVFGTLFGLSYYIYMISGQNIITIFVALTMITAILLYLLVKKRKEEKL